MGLYLLDYGAGNVQSLANTLNKLGYEFSWIRSRHDFEKATSLIFPGVGAFGTAIDHLTSQGLLEPLHEYIKSGKPYFGICIGMQVLFQSSTESPGSQGLGVIPSPIELFENLDKSVPHMGWNLTTFLDPQEGSPKEGIDSGNYYYFVHSFRAQYEPNQHPVTAQWAHTTSQYGKEIFVASIRKGNVFGTQFHPEKSGAAGLKLIDQWLTESEEERASAPLAPRVPLTPRPRDGLTKRIIACMDVRTNDEGDLVVTKGDQYDVREKTITPSTSGTSTPAVIAQKTAGAVRNLGKPVSLAAKYYYSGADELCLLNITSFRHSPLHDQPMLAVVRAAAECVFVPLTIGGGIKDSMDPDGTRRSALDVAGAYFRAGADKVSIGSEAVYAVENMIARGEGAGGDGTTAIETIARVYGRQAVVVSVDPKRVYIEEDPLTYDGPYKDELIHGPRSSAAESHRERSWWYQCTVSGGRETRPLSVVQLCKGAEKLGAGEILLNSIDRDGTGLGFDLELVRLVKRHVKIPVVASSGAGNADHFVDVFQGADVEAALAAGIFHRGEVEIEEVKEALRDAGINSRV